jgi:hypothetical protein
MDFQHRIEHPAIEYRAIEHHVMQRVATKIRFLPLLATLK